MRPLSLFWVSPVLNHWVACGRAVGPILDLLTKNILGWDQGISYHTRWFRILGTTGTQREPILNGVEMPKSPWHNVAKEIQKLIGIGMLGCIYDMLPANTFHPSLYFIPWGGQVISLHWDIERCIGEGAPAAWRSSALALFWRQSVMWEMLPLRWAFWFQWGWWAPGVPEAKLQSLAAKVKASAFTMKAAGTQW